MVFMLLFVCLLLTSCTQKPRRKVIAETFLDKINYGIWVEPSFYVSPDLARITYEIMETPIRTRMVTNGEKSQQTYSGIGSAMIRFSPDSQHLAYVIHKGEKCCLVVDGQEGKGYDKIDTFWEKPHFTPDNKSIVYVAQEGEKFFVVLNEKEGRRYDWIDSLVISPDGQKMAYVARRDKIWFIVFNGRETMPRQEEPFDLIFSPDSQRLAYTRSNQKTKKNTVFLDHQAGKEYYYTRANLVFSPDAQHFAYVADLDRERKCIVVDGQETALDYDEIEEHSLCYSPDSKYLAFAAKKGGEWLVVIGQKKGRPYEEVIIQSLITGFRQHARIFFESPTRLRYLAKKDGSIYLIQEEIKG